MTYKLPHDKDFATNGDLPRYLNENAQATEQAIDDIYQRIGKLEEKEKTDIDQLKGSITDLDKAKATRQDLQAVENEWKEKIEHVALGTDYQTVEKAVEQILTRKGLI